MAISQAELMTALQTLLSTVKFRLRGRRGTTAQLNPALMKAGELAFCTDTRTLYACYVDGTVEQVSHGFIPKATYGTIAALQAAHPTGEASDYFMVGTGPYHLYNWDGAAWADMGVWNDMSIYATNGTVGTLSSLLTTAKNNLVASINELFTSKMNLAGGSANPFTAMPYLGTAPIIESGAGYTKYADGTLICYGKKTFAGVPITTVWGGLFISAASTAVFDAFPINFIAVPIVVPFIGHTGTTGSCFVMSDIANMPSVTSPGGICGARGTTGTIAIAAEYIAIGRWKA